MPQTMNLPKHFSKGIVFISLCAFGATSHAANNLSGTGYSPFDDANCLISGLDSGCFQGDLLGPVSRILSPDAKHIDGFRVFDRSGREVGGQSRINDFFGGWNRYEVSFRADGTQESVSMNGKLIGVYKYKDGLISKFESFNEPGGWPSCTYVVLDSSPERTLLSESCGRSESIASFNGKRQLLKLYGGGVAQRYIRTGYPGPIECAYEMAGENLISVCTDGYFKHRIERDKTGRKLTYRRTGGRESDLVAVQFSYANDKYGNWTIRTMKYEEAPTSLGSLPKDVIQTRVIEYFPEVDERSLLYNWWLLAIDRLKATVRGSANDY